MRRIRNVTAFYLLAVAFLSGCDSQTLQWTSDLPYNISGKVLHTSVQAVSAQCSQSEASLYELASNGDKIEPALLSTSVDAEGNYSFDVKSLSLKFKNGSPQQPLVVVMQGCSTLLSRPITGIKDQNVSVGSTLLGFTLNTPEKAKLREGLLSQKDKLALIISSLEQSSTLQEAYQALNSTQDIKQKFEDVLGVPPSILNDASPSILTFEVPTQGNELQALTFKTSSTHWSPAYDIAYLWKLDNTTLAQTASTSFTPHANFQGTHTLTLYVGKDKGGGVLDLDKPYKTLSQTLQIQNSHPAVPPSLSLITASPTSLNSVQVAINTGAGLGHCQTFSKLALTVDALTAPLDLSQYNITCTTVGSQTQSVNLPSGDGPKEIRLWALDATNNISATASSVVIVLEQNPPVLSIVPFASSLRGGSSLNVTFNAEDLGSGIAQAILEYASDGSTFNTLTTLSDPSQVQLQYTWSVPLHNTATAKLRLRARDGAGNWSTVLSNAFTIDSTAPAAPNLSLSSAALTNNTAVQVQINCDADYAKVLFKENSSTPPETDTDWENCTSTKTWTVSGEGSHSIFAWSKDSVGNISASDSVSMTLDQSAPTVSLTSLNAGSFKGGTTQNITWTATDLHLTATPIRLDYTLNNGGTWTSIATNLTNSGSYSWTLPVVDSNSLKVRVSAQDSAGNTGTALSAAALVLDSTSPAALGLVRTSEAYSNSTTATFTVSGCSGDATKMIFKETSSTPDLNDVAWENCATTKAFTVSAAEGSKNIYAWAKDTVGNISAITSSSFILDTTLPDLNLTSAPTGTIKGGSTQTLTWNSSDTNPAVNALTLSYSTNNGSTWTALADNQANSGSYNWTVPTVDSTQVKIKVLLKDLAQNTSEEVSAVFAIDSQAPALPTVTLASSSYSNNSTVQLNLSTCSDIAKIIINESLILPSLADAGWQTCSVNPNYIIFGEGLHNLQVWVQDAVGNLTSTSASVQMTLDTTVPNVSLTSLNSGSYKGNEIQNITWSASDLNPAATPIALHYSADNGSTWTAIAAGANSGSHAWTLPALNSTQVRVRVTMTDLAGNSSSAVSTNALTVDSTAPGALTLTRTSPALSNSTSLGLTISNCSGDAVSMLLKETATTPTAADSGWEVCTTSRTFITSTGDGTKTIYAWAKDSVGNISSVTSTSMILDQTSPSVSLTSFNSTDYFAGGSTKQITWSASDAHFGTNPIRIEFSSDDGGSWEVLHLATANDGTESWSLPAIDSIQCKLRLSATDEAGNPTTSVVSAQSFTIDSSKPTVLTNSLFLNGSQTPPEVSNNNVLMSLSAQDITSPVSHVCFKYNTTQKPLAADSCWASVAGLGGTVSKNVVLNNAPFRVGFSQGTYAVYLWVKDLAGNISDLTNDLQGTASTDRLDVTYTPGAPPEVINVLATATDSPASPVSGADLTVPVGSSVFIRWTATDPQGLPALPIRLFYTIDDAVWTEISGGPFSNGSNGSCSVNPPYTGCYKWTNGSPSSAFFRIRVQAVDDSNLATSTTSLSLNPQQLRFIAGNTDLGTDNSAASAILLPSANSDSRMPVANSLVIHPTGTMYVIDKSRGIMKIDPADGLLKVFLKRTGTTSGDGGSVYDATAKTPLKINLDYQNRLLVWDYDRIRRIDLSENPPKIQTIIGGGNDSASQTYASPLNLKFTDIGSSFNFGNATFSPLPNGDFIFKSEKYPENGSNSTRLRIFHDSTNSISSVTFQGPAIPGHPEIDVKNCTLLSAAPVVDSSGTLTKYLVSFFTSPPSSDADCTYNNGWNYFQAYFDLNGDFVSNVNALGHGAIILGKDFKNYFVRREAGVVYQLDPNTSTWSAVAGKGKGICEDSLDVLNAECRLIVEDAFINANGKMYLFDNNTIRALRDDNTLLTLAGQNLSFGDNLDAINARFTNITSVDTWNDGGVLKTTTLDIGAARIREFPVAGGAITTIAGNGNALQPNTGLDAHTTSMSPRSSQFILNKSNGNLYYIFNDKDIGLLNRSTNRWSRVVGGGTADYYNSDNTVGTSIEFNTTVTPLAFENNKLMLVSNWSNVAIGGTHRSMLKIYDSTDSYRQSHFMGTDSNTNPAYCATGTAVASCTFSAADSSLRTFYDSLDGFWLHARRGTKNIYQLPPGGNVASFTNVTQNMRAMTYYRRPNNSQVIFYCGSDGKLYKKELSSGVESEISLAGVPGMTCDGFGLSYVPSRDSLVFIYKKNDLSGVAEILAP